MKRSQFAMFTVFFVGVMSGARAQSATGQTPMNGIAVINFNGAVLRTTEAQRELSALQVKFASRQEHLQALNSEVETMRGQLSSRPPSAGDVDSNSKQQALGAKERQLQREAEDFKNDSEAASQQAFQAVAQKMYIFVQGYAQTHALSLVVERGSDVSPVVWYAANNVDITDQVIQAYNLTATVSPKAKPDGGQNKPALPLPAGPKPH